MAEPVLRLVPDDEPHRVTAPWPPAARPSGPATKTVPPGPPSPVVAPAGGPHSGATSPVPEGATNGHVASAASEPDDRDDAPGGGELELYGRPKTAGERSWQLARHWAGMAAENAARPGGLGHGIIRGHPSSAGQHLGYVRSRAWVPERHEGGAASKAGAAYGYTIGLAGVFTGNTITWLFERPLRLVLFCLSTGIAVLIIAFTW